MIERKIGFMAITKFTINGEIAFIEVYEWCHISKGWLLMTVKRKPFPKINTDVRRIDFGKKVVEKVLLWN